ncbi:ABC transporter [Klebsiella pneumoniae]|uniref:ABC transporter n=1 Tax=Klebsiella pneumoniae TaxID=573 RepID=A0A4P0Y2N5_KLEPN|nr:ABC transporter [Klebsiella pneumoniae]
MYEGTNVADRRVSDTSLSDIVNLIVGEKFTGPLCGSTLR